MVIERPSPTFAPPLKRTVLDPIFALEIQGSRCVRCHSFCNVNCGEMAILERFQIIKPGKALCKSCAEREGYDRDRYEAALEVEAL